MAFYRTGGGGSATETVLWTNGSPTSSFASQTVTLSQTIENFDYIKIVFRKSTTNADEGILILPTKTVKESLNNTASTYRCCIGLCVGNSNSTYVRTIFVNSGVYDAIGIDTATRLNASGTSNITAIPTQIIGLKY
jgi:hypothetical protein